MKSYSKPPGQLWTQSTEIPGMRISAAVFGVIYPLVYFFTEIEDPGRAEPLWQYQLIGVVFLCVAASSFTERGRPWLRVLYHGALFIAAAWAVHCAYARGYHGTRFVLTTVAYCGALFVLHPIALALYILLLIGGGSLGILLQSPPHAWQLIGRITAAALFVGGITSIRLWIRGREGRRNRSLRSLVQGSPVPTLLLARDVCQLANDAATRLLGISPGENVREHILGEPPWWLSHERRGSAQTKLRTRHGAELWCEVAFAPVAEEPDLIQVTLVDKTSDRDLGRIKDELLAGLGRELRPPLASVKRALLAGEGDGSDTAGAMRDLERIERLLEDMLLIHSRRPDAGLYKLPIRVVIARKAVTAHISMQTAAISEHAGRQAPISTALHADNAMGIAFRQAKRGRGVLVHIHKAARGAVLRYIKNLP